MPHATEEQTTSDDGIKHTLFVSDDDVCAPAAGGSCLGIRITDETYLSFDHAGPDFVSDGSVVTIIYAGDADIYAVGADTRVFKVAVVIGALLFLVIGSVIWAGWA